MTRYSTRLFAATVITLLSPACSVLEPRPDPSRFYVLTSTDLGTADGTAMPNLALGLGPILLPDYLQRQELIRRTGPTEVRPSSVDRWAGTLDSNIKRVMAENLARQIGTDRIWVYPSLEITRTDYTIDITVVRFDLDTQNNALLNARWEVRDNKIKTRSVSRETRTTSAASSPDAGAGVEALSRTLGDLGRDITAVVREMAANRRN